MTDSPTIKKLRLLLLLLIVELTFEGLLRKIAGSWAKVPLFFLKDILVLVLALVLARVRKPPAIDFLWSAYSTLALLMSPLILLTAIHDPVLAVFGAKQYLLFPIVGLATFTAFEEASIKELYHFLRLVALLIVPTGVIAIMQLRLPMDHWLNLSVDGDSLDAFSAAGKLRVSSTFAFGSQYCMFLNAQICILIAAVTLKGESKGIVRIGLFSLIPLLVLSNYVTGSRGAVVGSGVIMMIGAAFSSIKFRFVVFVRSAAICGALYFCVGMMQNFFPDAFEAYSERQEGNLMGTGSEINQRAFDTVLGWTGASTDAPIVGHGLGIMSNGIDKLSDYAASYRKNGGWTETDYATTYFEGGLYFILVWYGFRYYVIFQTAIRFIKDTQGEFATAGAFCQGFIAMTGVIGTLGIQPPLSIWWWLTVGFALVYWWKSIEPAMPNGMAVEAPAVLSKPVVRGRSIYSERLHDGDDPQEKQ